MDRRAEDFEAQVQETGRHLRASMAQRLPRLYRGVNGWLLRGVMADAGLQQALFQLVDALPQLGDDRELARHLAAYLDAAAAHGLRPAMLRLAARPALAFLVRRGVARLARQFLVEETPAGLARVHQELARVPASISLDAVGEAVLSQAEADAYLARALRLLEQLARFGPPQLSLKLTALTPHFDPLDAAGTRSRVLRQLAPLMEAAIRLGATLTVDMEERQLKDAILELFFELLECWPDPAWQPAIALQAYLPETGGDVDRVLAAAQRHGRRLGLRLVKGAYWDQEAAWAELRGWPRPTFAVKANTDAHYEALTRRLLENCDSLLPSIASHNLRSQAVALTCARGLALAPERWQAQMLFGMAEPLRDALVGAGARLSIYLPSGDPLLGIAYLIRRLMENTQSSSALRLTYVEQVDTDTLLAAPQAAPEAPPPPSPAFTNLPLLDFSRSDAQQGFTAALAQLRSRLPIHHSLAGSDATPAARHLARNPAAPDELLGEIALGDGSHAEALLARAEAAFPAWRATPAPERVRIMHRAAALLVARRQELAALMLLEAGKTRREADADVAEAVDFLRYYADTMQELDGWRASSRFAAERNETRYEPRGVALVIAPWNFPLAILAGMSAAALVSGNCAIIKPAQAGLLIGHEFQRALLEAGVPAAVCPLLAAPGEVAGALVGDPRIQVIAFTGSRQVGLSILQAAHTQVPGQRQVKQVVCEMGGKNAIIVDADADLDEAIAGILESAFGYAGQKCSACSRVIAVGAVHDRLLDRLVAAAAALPWGAPEDPGNRFGPLISAAAQRQALDYIAIGESEGRLVWRGSVPAQGWFAPPCIFAAIRPAHRLAREEIFAPLLAVMAADDFATALAMAQDSDYALTGGVYSRLPEHLELARQHYRVGDLYLNRKITGARVAAQPFGGVALSGTGVQAGGPDYLKQFMWSRMVSSNLMRHGYVTAR